MLSRFRVWLGNKWLGSDPSLLQSYRATFATPHGQRVLQHLLDSVYCTIVSGPAASDLAILAAHNARRAFLHEILENIDMAEHPQKYEITTTEEQVEKP